MTLRRHHASDGAGSIEQRNAVLRRHTTSQQDARSGSRGIVRADPGLRAAIFERATQRMQNVADISPRELRWKVATMRDCRLSMSQHRTWSGCACCRRALMIATSGHTLSRQLMCAAPESPCRTTTCRQPSPQVCAGCRYSVSPCLVERGLDISV